MKEREWFQQEPFPRLPFHPHCHILTIYSSPDDWHLPGREKENLSHSRMLGGAFKMATWLSIASSHHARYAWEKQRNQLSTGEGVARKRFGTILKSNCIKRIKGFKNNFPQNCKPPLTINVFIVIFFPRAINQELLNLQRLNMFPTILSLLLICFFTDKKKIISPKPLTLGTQIPS